MSYDIDLKINTGIDYYCVCDVGNYTSNVHRIWEFGLGHPLSELKETIAQDAIPLLEIAIARLTDPANFLHLKTMEPKNGWGNLEGATDYLKKLLQGCKQHPATTIKIYH